MSQTQTRPQPMAASAAETKIRADLAATAQFLSFDPGLYAVDFSVAQSASTDIGLRLPCLRLEPIPPTLRQKGRAFVSSLAEGGWVWRGEEPTFVLVVGAQAGLVLTVYKASDGMPSPQIRIRNIGAQGLGAPRPTVAPVGGPPAAAPMSPPVVVAGAEPVRATPPQPVPVAALREAAVAVPLSQLVHVRSIGDVKTSGTDWTGKPGSRAPVEGFAIMPIGAIGKESLEYQAVLGNNWNTPWFSGGEFCGSRGLALELLGFRVRLTGEAAEHYDCKVWGSFIDKEIVGPIEHGDVCEAEGAPLEAIRILISPRARPAAPETAPEAADPEPVPTAPDAAEAEAPEAVMAAKKKTSPKSPKPGRTPSA